MLPEGKILFPASAVPAVLRPERFRGGCAFGAGIFGRSLPLGCLMSNRFPCSPRKLVLHAHESIGGSGGNALHLLRRLDAYQGEAQLELLQRQRGKAKARAA